MNVAVIIPALNPDHRLLEVVNGLIHKGFGRIILVNDGSASEHMDYFNRVEALPQCTVLKHEINHGKGRALKTAFSYLLSLQPDDLVGVITVDADNQHHPDDIWNLAQALTADPSAVILGVRDFSANQVPPRSRFGNRLTSRMLRWTCDVNISDTQTGLRAIPTALLPVLLTLQGERFEYETNMLLAAKRYRIKLREIPIKTIYFNENASSHYRTLLDSFRILRIVLIFFASSGISTFIDVGLYWLLYSLMTEARLSTRIFAATVIARILSSSVNFLLNRQVVFMCRSKLGANFARYYILAAIQMMVSYFLVFSLASLLGGHSVPIKLLVDMLLFFVSFYIQRTWVFNDC